MKFNIVKVLAKVKATNPVYLENTVSKISDIIVKSAKIIDIVGINITNQKIGVYEVGSDPIQIYRFERMLAKDIKEVANTINESKFDIEIAIPIGFSPSTYNIWDNRKVMTKTPDVCQAVVDHLDDAILSERS